VAGDGQWTGHGIGSGMGGRTGGLVSGAGRADAAHCGRAALDY
jgi:hypothetical protein